MGINKILLKIPHIQFIAADSVLWGDITGLITDQTDLVDFVNDNINNLVTGVITDIQNDITNIQGNIVDIQTNISTIEGDITNIQNDIVTINTTIAGIQSDITSIYTSITNIEDDISNINNTIDIINDTISDIQSDITTIQGNIANIQADLSALESRVKTNEDDIADLKTKDADLQQQIDDIDADISTINSNITNINANITNIQTDVSSAQNDITDIQSEILDLKAKDVSLQSQITDNKNDITTLDGRVTVNESDIAELKLKDTDLQQQIDNNKTSITGLQGDVADINTDIANIQTDVSGLDGRVTTNEDDITNIKADYAKSADLATVATSGSYTDLTNKPDLSIYAKDADLAQVAKSGDYNDLSNKPDVYIKTEVDTLLDDKVDKESGKGLSTNDYDNASKTKLDGIETGAQKNVQSDWEQTDTSEDSYIQNKPDLSVYAKSADLASVATSGSYNDLTDKPDVYTRTETNTLLNNKVDKVAGKGLSDENYTATEKTKLSGIEAGAQVNVQSDWSQTDITDDSYIQNKPDLSIYAKSADLSDVAKSGEYNDLLNKPSLGTMAAEDKTDYVTVTDFNTGLDGKVTKVHPGTNVTVTGTDKEPIISVTGIELPEKFTASDSVTGVVGDTILGLNDTNVTAIVTGSVFGLNDVVIFSNGIQGQVVAYDSGAGTYDIVIVQIPEATAWGAIGGTLANQTDLQIALDLKANTADLATVATSGSYNDLTDKPIIPTTGWGTITGTLSSQTDLQSALDTKTNDADLAQVAKSGDYNDLSNKPDVYIKTEVDTLLDDKVDKESGKGLSTNDFTNADKTKLDGIEAGAQVNVQSDWSQTDITDDSYIQNKPDLSIYAKSADLSDVAKSGDYNDLSNKPTIPTVPADVSAFNNDAGYITANDIPDVDLTNVVKYDAQKNVDLTGEGNLIVDASKKLIMHSANIETIDAVSTPIGLLSLIDIPVGYNLRGKTIIFAPSNAPNIQIDSVISIPSLDVSITGGMSGYIRAYTEELNMYMENSVESIIYTNYNNAGWINKSYTFANDADYIVNNNTLNTAIITAVPSGTGNDNYSLSDAYVQGQYSGINLELGDTIHNTSINSKDRPTWNDGNTKRDIATTDQLFKHAFVTQAQYDALGDRVRTDGVTYFILSPGDRTITIVNNINRDPYFLISTIDIINNFIVSEGDFYTYATQIGANSTGTISKYMDNNQSMKTLTEDVTGLAIYYGVMADGYPYNLGKIIVSPDVDTYTANP